MKRNRSSWNLCQYTYYLRTKAGGPSTNRQVVMLWVVLIILWYKRTGFHGYMYSPYTLREWNRNKTELQGEDEVLREGQKVCVKSTRWFNIAAVLLLNCVLQTCCSFAFMDRGWLGEQETIPFSSILIKLIDLWRVHCIGCECFLWLFQPIFPPLFQFFLFDSSPPFLPSPALHGSSWSVLLVIHLQNRNKRPSPHYILYLYWC